ncbi:MarR family transcriptional regulator [Lactiplantibacillus fabifermentans T30PCM01]|uniref:MarR family transcriptional regulator n=1 Tax=Lactiplantibacillus fabifermentans T30PCM01 TaxID=1400520 RepID=W6TBK6_9LACO|nr:hypothetical protein [Lactiplantibacillus fabifermentans]ETY72805.1 MarR family transcriptional regulator [Lactiplantibacillus fabifermentans T30PCM01]
MTDDELANQIAHRIRQIRVQKNNVNREQQWMQAHLTDANLRATLPKISIVGLHMLSAIATQPQTGIELAATLDVTRGGITRAAKTLTQLALVEPFQPTNEHKKVYYRLTPTGQTIAKVHDAMHAEFNQAIQQQLYGKYDPEDLQLVNHFLTDLLAFEQNFH